VSPAPEIVDFLSSCGLHDLTQERLAVLETFRVHLEQVNAKTNLTRVTAPRDFWAKHVADSLSIAAVLPEFSGEQLSVADVGCGGGFPLLPLAWAFPQLRLVGIDSKHRKIDFVNDCCRIFGWQHCSAFAYQAREAARQAALKASFDVVVSRAMSDCARVFRECRGLLKPATGRVILYKTPTALQDEGALARREAAKFGFRFDSTGALSLPAEAGQRQFGVFTRDA